MAFNLTQLKVFNINRKIYILRYLYVKKKSINTTFRRFPRTRLTKKMVHPAIGNNGLKWCLQEQQDSKQKLLYHSVNLKAIIEG